MNTTFFFDKVEINLLSSDSFDALRFPAVSMVEMKSYRRLLQVLPIFSHPLHVRLLLRDFS